MLPFFNLPTYLMCYWCYNLCPFYLIHFFLCSVSSDQSQHGVIVGWLKCTINVPIQLLQLFGINMKESVSTLALSSRPRQGLAKGRAKSEPGNHISCSWECKRIWGNEHSHSEVSSHFGSWSLDGFLNFHWMILGVKTHWIKTFIISLESS
jgi:hypothetical protein